MPLMALQGDWPSTVAHTAAVTATAVLLTTEVEQPVRLSPRASLSLDGPPPRPGLLPACFDVILESPEVSLHTLGHHAGGVSRLFDHPLRLIL